MEDFSKPKIVWGEISDKTKFCLDSDGRYVPEATTFLMIGNHLDYLLCFMNSLLSEYLFSKLGTTTGVGTVRWKKFKLESLIVPCWTQERENALLPLLDKIRLHTTPQNERFIDEVIFKICGISEEEKMFINMEIKRQVSP